MEWEQKWYAPGLAHKTIHILFLSTDLIQMSIVTLEVMNWKCPNHMIEGDWVPELPCIRKLPSKQGYLLGVSHEQEVDYCLLKYWNLGVYLVQQLPYCHLT